MADKLTREEKRVMLRERYGSAFAPPLPKKTKAVKKSGATKKTGKKKAPRNNNP